MACQIKLQIYFLNNGLSRNESWLWAQIWIAHLGTEEFKKEIVEYLS